jgi:hypothetical protein
VLAPQDRPRPAPTQAAAEARTIHPILIEAERLWAESNPAAVRALLEKLPEDTLSRFNGAEAELYQELVASIGDSDRDQALRDLDGGLDAGSVTMLRRAVTALSSLTRDELDADPVLAGKLERAQQALAASQRLRDAERADP